jgi:hypothetical protein
MMEDNSFRVVVADSTDETAVLDGFTVAAGRRHSARSVRMGDTDGLYVNNAGHPTIADCRFTNNHAGAVSVDSSPIFTDCIFEGNAYALDIREEAVVSLNNCTFLDHHTSITITDSEAALTGCNFERTFWTGVKSSHSTLVLTDCTFTATEFHGALDIDSGDVALERCVFSGNAGSHGGAIELTAGTLIASDCVFINNTSHSGGAIGFQGNLDLRNCYFRNNYSTFEGGALAGIGKREQAAVVSGCTFTGNTAVHNGGAISLFLRSIILSHCTFAGNRGTGPTIWALGGVEQNVELRHCIIWDGPAPFQPDSWIPRFVTIEYSNIEGGGWPGVGNIDVDPCFAEPGYWDPNGTPDDANDDVWTDGDYHLKSQAGRWDPVSECWVQDDVTSPCIDAGDPSTPVAFEPFPNGGVINMGAYGGTTEASKSPSGIHTKYGGGTGEPNDPYLIYTAEQMNEIGLHEEDQDKHFKLMADIDLSAYSGTAFNMIGVHTRGGGWFAGVFDGDNHTISNFTYTSTTYSGYVGIFAYIRGARINNLGLIDPNIDAETGARVGSLAGVLLEGTITNCYVAGGKISGERNVGGLVGTNDDGTVSNCYSTCSVDGSDDVGGLVGRNDSLVTVSYSRASVTGQNDVGGLVGYNSYGAETINCYARGDILGQMFVGGLVGNNVTGGRGGPRPGTIRNCYSAAAVSGDEQVGGLAGHNEDGGVSGSFWDIEASGQTTSYGGSPKTTAEMQDPNTFMDAGWGFVGTTRASCDVWAEPDGGGYPVFWWQLSPLPELPTFSGGTGEPDNPYLISTADELNSIGNTPELMASSFRLIADIDLAGVDFCIVARQLYPFRGTFDGDGYTISNFSYTSAEASCVGLFGYVVGAEIRNLGLISPHLNVERGNYHGSLVGCLDAGTITNCYVEAGSISGNLGVGGLVGRSDSGSTITDSYCTGAVAGSREVGGLLGANRGIVTNCWSTCGIEARNDTGGLVGDNDGSIMNSWSHAGVYGRDAVGGLVGRNAPGEIVNCYARGNVAGHWYVGGLVGSNSERIGRLPGTIRNCYSATVVPTNSQSGGLVGNNMGGEVRDSFWDIETSGQTSSYGGTPKTTAEMQSAGTFLDAGWDFVDETQNGTEDIWWILEGQDYPRLWWELIENQLFDSKDMLRLSRP